MSTLEEIAKRFDALEATDTGLFQRRARVLQSMWRAEQAEKNGTVELAYACGEHTAREKTRPLGSRLRMPWAQDALANFLTERVREVVRREVLDPERSKGKLFGKPRIFNDLLSSQPLCFNLFAELCFDLALASRLVSHFTDGRFVEVVKIEFEHAPRPKAKYTGDASAFDVFLECRTRGDGRGFLGVEVKYHENLAGSPASHKPRYDEIAAQMGCFRESAADALKRQPLQQLWRNHLLTGAVQRVDGYDDAQFIVVYPRENEACRRAVEAYRGTLSDEASFGTWGLEEVVTFLRENTESAWPGLVWDRYCDFGRLERALVVEGA